MKHRRTIVAMFASILSLGSLAPAVAGADEAAALFQRTSRIEIRIPMQGGDASAVDPYRIEDPATIRKIVGAVRLDPTGAAAGWKWPNQIRFVLDDGSAIEASLGGVPGIFGVSLPGQGSRDYQVPAELLEILGPYLQRAVEYFVEAAGAHEAMSGANGRPEAGPALKPGEPMNGLKVSLVAKAERVRVGEEIKMSSTYENVGDKANSLVFWWNRRMSVVDADGKAVLPTAGPERPCGEREEVTVLEAGKKFERVEFFGCTQPSGCRKKVGWSYTLPPGTYRISLIFEAPAPHAYGQNDRPDGWRGKIVSNAVTVVVEK